MGDCENACTEHKYTDVESFVGAGKNGRQIEMLMGA